MNRQNKTKKVILIAVIIACLIAIIGGTYARYTSTGTANVSAEIAKWHVELNGTDISSVSQNVNVALEFDSNGYVADGKIAPGRTAHFDVELDPTGSEVAIQYTFNLDTSVIANALEENSSSSISITGATYRVGNEAAQNATLSGNTITVNESLSQVEAGNKVVVSVSLAWDETGENTSDTAEGVAAYNAGVEGKTITIPVAVTASQQI